MIVEMDTDQKQNYAELKKRMRQLMEENEIYKQDLVNTNEQLLKVTRDKSFLLDQLLQYEDGVSSSSDSDSLSDVETKTKVKSGAPSVKRKKPSTSKSKEKKETGVPPLLSGMHIPQPPQPKKRIPKPKGEKKPKGGEHGEKVIRPPKSSQSRKSSPNKGGPSKMVGSTGKTTPSKAILPPAVPLTPEQVELHLEQTNSKRVPLPTPQPASLTLPAELFNEDAFINDI